MKKKINFILIIFLCCSFLLEIFLRFYEKFNPLIFASEYGIPCLEKIDEEIYYTLKKNCTKKIKYHYLDEKINFRTNSCRLRDQEEYCSYLNNEDLKKIFFFGDSYTQNPYVNNQFNYSKILTKILKENNFDYIDLNFGISGYSLFQNISNLKKQLNKNIINSQDEIIFQFLLNDIYDITQHPPHPLKKYLNYSHTFKIFNYLRRKIKYGDSNIKLKEIIIADYKKQNTKKIIENNLCKLSKIINENNLKIHFLYIPYMEMRSKWAFPNDNEIMNYIINVAKKCGFKNIINPTASLKKHPFKDIVIDINNNKHLNQKGNEIVAQYIFKTLTKIE